jgi:uncharacterized protein YlaI
MKVNGWGYEPRGVVRRVVCPACDATLDFGDDEIGTTRLGAAVIRSIRCLRCRRGINLARQRSQPTPHGETLR